MATGDQPVPESTDQANTTSTAANPSEPSSTPVVAGSQGERIPLPPPVAAPTTVPEAVMNRIRFLEGFLLLLLLALTFLLGSYRASNSDLLLHLATGRLIAQGGMTFGSDPFTFTSSGVWVEHSWLFDLIAYLLFQIPSIGPIVLIVVKALAMTFLAWLMVQGATVPSRTRWIPLVCTILAILAASPRFHVQPAIVSMILLAGVISLLFRREENPRGLWWIPALCVVWVNMDEWFLLGPICVGVYLLGEWVQTLTKKDSPMNPDLTRTLGLVLVCSLVACLISPYHYRSFTTIPLGLITTGGLDVLAKDSAFRGYFFSPVYDFFEYIRIPLGHSVAGVSWFVLLGLSLLSFVLVGVYNFDGLRWHRVFLWLLFAILGAWNIRFIGLFAVVAGPIMALNFLDLEKLFMTGEANTDPAVLRWAVSGRVLTSVITFGLILATIPGVLHGKPFHRREVAWGVEINTSLQKAAEQIRTWQNAKLIDPGEHWYNLSPEIVGYLAWFAPGEKGAIDYRMNLFTGMAKDFVAITNTLAGNRTQEEAENNPLPWRKVFEDQKVRFVITTSSNAGRTFVTLSNLFANEGEFIPCFMDGNTTIFAWKVPKGTSLPAVPEQMLIDTTQLAFGKDPLLAPLEAAPIPGTATWWSLLYPHDEPTPWSVFTAEQHNLRFAMLQASYQRDILRDWVSLSGAQLVGFGTGGGLSRLSDLALYSRLSSTYQMIFASERPTAFTLLDGLSQYRSYAYARTRDGGPAADLYLAIRAARQGLLKAPDDVGGQAILAQSFDRMAIQTRERACTHAIGQPNRADTLVYPHPHWIRQSQIAAALKYVLKVSTRPEEIQRAHYLLSNAFSERTFTESRILHFADYVDISRRLGRFIDSSSDFSTTLKQYEARVKQEKTTLQRLMDQYEVNSQNKPLLQKAQIALQNGLSERALQLLLNADPKELHDPRNPTEVPGATMAMSLLLSLGQVDEARVGLLPSDSDNANGSDLQRFGTHPVLGIPAYPWYRVQLAAATGDYSTADKFLGECIEATKKNRSYSRMLVDMDAVPEKLAEKELTQGEFAGLLTGYVLMREWQHATGTPWQILRHVPARLHTIQGKYMPHLPYANFWLIQSQRFLLQQAEQQSDLWTVRAWLALEAGLIDKAREYADKALSLGDLGQVGKDQRLLVQFRSHPMASLILDRCRQGQAK